MQTGSRLTAFVPSTDLARSEAFYATVLGLPVRELTPYALVLDGLGTELRVTLVNERSTADYTVLGWVYKTGVEVVMLPITYRVIGYLKRHEPTYTAMV